MLKSGTLISTDIFHKVTDSQQYLIFNSCHPKHTKINIQFSLARRLCTIVSDKSVLLTRLKELSHALIQRKYPTEVINAGIQKAMSIPRYKLLEVKSKEKEDILPFISTHNPKNKEVFGIIKNNMDVLTSDETMSKILMKQKSLNAKDNSQTLSAS